MKLVFIIQGEGRGHMTQALALRDLLLDAGHKLSAVCVGSSKRRQIPAFFVEKIGAPVIRFRSPNFVTDENNKGILIGPTIWQNLQQTDVYLNSLSTMDAVIEEHRPDLVVNFYEPLWGLYQRWRKGKVPSVCVAHQFLASHQDFPFPEGRASEKAMMLGLNSVTAGGSSKRLCLSFTPMDRPTNDHLVVMPPLLRSALYDLVVTEGDFLLVYVMQAGYGEDIQEWHSRNPDVKIHCFWDRAGAPEVEEKAPGLTFHQLSDTKFLDMMAACRGLVTTAGFESVCEAMYLGKPVHMVPVEGHYEQACNALDAERAGAGMSADRFELTAFMDYLPRHRADAGAFRQWADAAAALFITELESAAAS